MRKKLKKVLNDDLLKHSSLVFVGAMTANIFNYFFQVTMGRMLEVETFGEMNALYSLLAVLAIPYTAITFYLGKAISHCLALKKEKEANDLILKSYKNLFIAATVFCFIGMLFSRGVADYLKIESTYPVLLLFLIIFVSLIPPINTGILQSFQNFKMLSFLNAGLGAFRYFICLLFVLAGYKLNGVLFGSVLTVIIVGYITFIPIRNHLLLGREEYKREDENIAQYIIPVLMASLSFTVLTQMDLVLVKNYFSPFDAGIYSSAAVIGRAVMVLPASIAVSMFPMVASSKAKDEGTLHLILKSLSMTLILSGSLTLVLFLFPELIISVFFGEKFIEAGEILAYFALAMLPMSFVMVLMNYNLAKGEKSFSYLMLIGAILEVVGIMQFHDSLLEVLKVILCSGLFCVVLLFALLAFQYYRPNVPSSR
ncbi:MAG: hypothetical protein HQK84_00685 [Nitrospinae bacterium]|nr:hypothetical protein [Nitrospinota bacterium]